MEQRTWYVVEENLASQPALLCEAATALLDLLEPQLAAAEVDLISDAHDLPALVRESRADLRAHAERTREADGRSRTATHALIDRQRPQWVDALRYAPWSIDAHFVDAHGDGVVEFHDTGQALVARLDVEEAAAARRTLGQSVTLSPLEEVHRRRAQERTRRRPPAGAHRHGALGRMLRRFDPR